MPELIFLIVLSFYFIFAALLLIGVRKKFPVLSENNFPSATIIVAARNEETNILRCLESLDKLRFPEGKLEIILVDDKSIDKTGEIIDEFIFNKNKFKKIVTSKEIGKLKGKTNALANAIEISRGEIILTTDADCETHPDWVYQIASYYQKDVAMVNGFTTQYAYNNFSGLQALDFIYLLIVASGTINLGFPISCIGNNMSYRKSVYKEVGGYENLPFSVTEDSLLLHAMNRLKKYKIVYPLDKNALITSAPCTNIKDLFRQKKRWSVGGLDVPLYGGLVMSFAFLANVGMLLTPLFFSPVWLYLAVFKLAIDFFILLPVHKELGLIRNLKYFLSFQIYYIIYAAIIPFALLFNRKVIWKNREYK